jgi:hypothetical protein
MRPLYFISSGFHLATPAYDDTGEPHIVLTPIVYFIPSPYDTDDEGDLSYTYEQPMPQGGWDTIEHPEQQLIRRPDGWYVTPEGLIGSEAAAIERFAKPTKRPAPQRWPKQALLAPPWRRPRWPHLLRRLTSMSPTCRQRCSLQGRAVTGRASSVGAATYIMGRVAAKISLDAVNMARPMKAAPGFYRGTQGRHKFHLAGARV